MNDQLLASWEVILSEHRELLAAYLHAVGRSKDAEELREIRALVQWVTADVDGLRRLCPELGHLSDVGKL
jgi:hypothetical protein